MPKTRVLVFAGVLAAIAVGIGLAVGPFPGNAPAQRVFGRDVIRLVKINKFYLEAVPEGFILMLNNRDVPGVVGQVGTLLGERNINIAGLQLGRETVGGMAISLIHVDERIPESVLQELRAGRNIISAHLLEL